MKFPILVFVLVCFNYLIYCEEPSTLNPKTDAELLPEAVGKERKKVQIFWAIMHEVCRTFCVWKKFCDNFCELFKPSDDDPDSDSDSGDFDFLRSTLTTARQSGWVHSSVTRICEEDPKCVQNCLKMLIDTHESDAPDETPSKAEEETTTTAENVFKKLFHLARKYFTKCAQTNNKPLDKVDLITGEEFCREITHGRDEFATQCVKSLT